MAVAVFALAAAVMRLVRRRGLISRALAGLVKWLVAVILLAWLEQTLPPGRTGLDVALTLALLAAIWMACRQGLDVLYDMLYLAQGEGQPGRHILKDLCKFLILIVLIGAGLRDILNVQIGSLLTSSAILTAVIGLSMQDTIGSLLSGLLLEIEKPFQIGDWIKMGKTEGRVAGISWRYTKVVTLDANVVLLPNNLVAKERLVNYNRPGAALRRVVPVPAPADTPPVRVKSAILTALARAEGVAANPAPMVRLTRLRADQAVYAAIFYVTRFNAAIAAEDAVLSAVWYEFLERGIELPPPGRRLSFRQHHDPSAAPERTAALAKVQLLAGMAESDLQLLAKVSVTRRFAPGQTVFAKGETGTTMSIVVSGQVAVLADDRQLASLGAGQIFGEMALLTGEPRQATIRALAATTCLEVDREGFRMVLSRHPEIVERVRRICEERTAPADSGQTPAAGPEGGTLFSMFKRLFP